MTGHPAWPTTLEQALRLLERLLPEETLREFSDLSEAELPLSHFGLGSFVREHFGLWAGNRALLRDCARVAGRESEELDPDDAAMLMLERLWIELRARKAARKPH